MASRTTKMGQMPGARSVVAAIGLSLGTVAAAQLPTNGAIESPIGKLDIVNGYPTDATVRKLYDSLDFQRAVQAYLWALPYIAMGQWQDEQRAKFGARELDYVDYFDFKDKLGLLTANATTPYSMAFPNLAKTGPLVFEFPAGQIAGGILDFWQRPITDTGALGPDKQKGGKYLILGPNDKDIKPAGYLVFRSPTNNVWSGQRGLAADLDEAKAVIGKMKIYPNDNARALPATHHIRPEGRKWSGEQPRGPRAGSPTSVSTDRSRRTSTRLGRCRTLRRRIERSPFGSIAIAATGKKESP